MYKIEFEKNFRDSRKLPQAHEKSAMKMKKKVLEEKKTTAASKKFLWKEGFYKAISEDWLNRFRRTSGY